jgi:hypothetical protein
LYSPEKILIISSLVRLSFIAYKGFSGFTAIVKASIPTLISL